MSYFCIASPVFLSRRAPSGGPTGPAGAGTEGTGFANKGTVEAPCDTCAGTDTGAGAGSCGTEARVDADANGAI